MGPTHFNLTCAPDLLPDPINSTNQLKPHFTITSLLHFYFTHRWFLPPSPSLKLSPQHLSLNVLTPLQSRSDSPRNFQQGLKSIRCPCSSLRDPFMFVQGMGILKPIHICILKPQIQIQTHPYPIMECSKDQKYSVMKNKKKKKKKKKEL